MHPHFIACNNPFQESLSFFKIQLQKLCVHSHVPICKLLWNTTCIKSVIPEVIMDDGL